MNTALITGITGQDASYLSEFLLEKNYKVVGIKRRTSTNTLDRIGHIKDDIEIIDGDISDASSITGIISHYKPDEIYNLAAQSHVGISFNQPSYTFDVNTVGLINILESVRTFSKDSKVYQASSSEIFGNSFDKLEDSFHTVYYQDENTCFNPNSPYAISKLASHYLVQSYRKGYDLFVCAGILHNHESPRRGENFVTRKITKWIGEFSKWTKNMERVPKTVVGDSIAGPNDRAFPKLRLGNIKAKRDWSHSKDMVKAMWMMLQADEPKDYVVGSDCTHSVEDFLTEAFKCINIDSWRDYIVIDPKFHRPNDVEHLCAKSSLIRQELGWQPEISFKQLVQDMVESDIKWH
jgi:GDPmannose 4,6-dehydratase